ncbi:molybdenum ABC transporter ATP-binding protein ModC [Shewanella sp. D64]|uniref:molybdenum ABC transporter ATP-binding protein ModC n=1 Tax=unclassified Shewanella TaxID=196818 RepID=UPI0022BA17C0|nr:MULTISPECIES: molybdenum ABC transporter ATP-binding protein ModC [unclassified Shewanella]MEC4729035.1 molybdenum ABC transporter ATP-binding protein ModC [Shewanella sp. D64]MEC4739890.1 molybdenum ABC transporter ATP-binding protein ModC [Shewanella sp. E94]WBJ98126.1 molybdenum ABC transporter ATP-binding protein ModC [Shewanella sp. MTB7]
MLNIKISKQLGDLALSIDAQLPMHGISAIFGRSGAGKTSLINILGGLSTPDQGELTLGEESLYDHARHINLPPEKRSIGYVFQEARLFPHYRVRGNLNYGNKDKDPVHFDKVVKLLGLEHLLKRYPISLSGGERQRVAIGRALLTRPKMLLMDEPLASLDLPRKRELISYLSNLARNLTIPIIYVSHSLDEILQLAEYMLVLDQGRVIAIGPLQQVWDSEQMRPWLPASEQSSLLDVTVAEVHSHYSMTRVKLNNEISLWVNSILPDQGAKLRVRIHANHISLCLVPPQQTSIRNIIPVKVVQVLEPQGENNVQVKLDIVDHYLWANVTRWACDDLGISPGLSLFAQIKGVSMTTSDLAQSH